MRKGIFVDIDSLSNCINFATAQQSQNLYTREDMRHFLLFSSKTSPETLTISFMHETNVKCVEFSSAGMLLRKVEIGLGGAM